MKTQRQKSAQERELGSIKNEREKKKAEKVKHALVMLDVDLRAFDRSPKFMEMLEHHSLGGLEQVVAAMRLSSDPIVQQFLARWDELNPEYKKIVPWEAIAQKLELDTRQLLGAIIIALRDYSAMEVKLEAITAHAQITKSTVNSAMIPGNEGYRDRQLIHTALGFLAPPKGQTINVNMPGSLNESDEMIAAEDIDMNEMFPDLMSTQRKMLPD
jgi:hypothetical protein